MSKVEPAAAGTAAALTAAIPPPVLEVFRGVGQVFFQENALSGALFVLGIAVSSPLLAAAGLVGSAIGWGVARGLKYDAGETAGGIYGFNPALVGIATLFFFQPGPVSIVLMLVGCVVATLVTRAMRGYLPFPTYTTPFIVTTWVVYFVGKALGAALAGPGYPALLANPPLSFGVEATAHGVGQVMFQGSLWTGLLFLIGIAVSDREHAGWVLLGSFVGLLVASYHVTFGSKVIDPERLIERDQLETILLGLYGYNATLAPVALFLWRRSLIAPLLGMVLCVPLTELMPLLGLPALTAPFVLATWIVLALQWLEARWVANRAAAGSA